MLFNLKFGARFTYRPRAPLVWLRVTEAIYVTEIDSIHINILPDRSIVACGWQTR